jgi:hypothetical protein
MSENVKSAINAIKRKANILQYDGERMGIRHSQQHGEELERLIEILERAIKRENDG